MPVVCWMEQWMSPREHPGPFYEWTFHDEDGVGRKVVLCASCTAEGREKDKKYPCPVPYQVRSLV